MKKMTRKIKKSRRLSMMGIFVPFFNYIEYYKEFGDVRGNPAPVRGEGNIGVEDQAGKFFLL